MSELSEWISIANLITTSICTTGKIPYVLSNFNRYSSLACMPLWCGLCFTWSTVWRLIACPFQCICHGLSASCSNNGCTNISDDMMIMYFDKTTQRQTLKKLSITNIVSASADQKISILALIDKLLLEFTGEYTKKHYMLCENVVNQLTGITYAPADVFEALTNMRSNLT